MPTLAKTLVIGALSIVFLAAQGTKELDRLIKDLEAANPDSIDDTRKAIAEIGAPAVSALVFVLANQYQKPLARKLAAETLGRIYTLGRIGPSAKAAVEALINGVRDPDPDVRNYSEEALVSMAVVSIEGGPVVAALIDVLKNPQSAAEGERVESILCRIGGASVPALMAALKEDDAKVSRRAALVLRGFSGSNDATRRIVVSALLAEINDRNSSVRVVSLEILGWVGRGFGIGESQLAGALQDSDPAVREAAAATLSYLRF